MENIIHFPMKQKASDAPPTSAQIVVKANMRGSTIRR